ncbi:MAG TPA: 5-oxoprolinase subunit PxpB [Rudaea sp.]|nr:5-oxoprolinase subunit PxpB [Rudaea sp.]
MNAPRIEPLGDCAALIHCGEIIDAAVNARALAIAHALEDARLPGIVDIAPAYASVCVRYEPAAWTSTDPAQSPFDRVAESLRTLVDNASSDATADSGSIEIPVTYGGKFGPDLADVAAHTGLTEKEVVARHSAAQYRVAMLGFTPGFPYLLGLDPTLYVPRRATPRTRVPAGSVAIGGAQTGVYPRETPGGWHLIGRTSLHLFDPARDPPALLKPGMRVRFVAQ